MFYINICNCLFLEPHLIDGRAKMIEQQGARRYKLEALDGNAIDTIFIDMRNKYCGRFNFPKVHVSKRVLIQSGSSKGELSCYMLRGKRRVLRGGNDLNPHRCGLLGFRVESSRFRRKYGEISSLIMVYFSLLITNP